MVSILATAWRRRCGIQTRESSISVGCGGVVLHGVARSKSTSVDRGGECHAGGEVVRSQRGHK